MMTEEERHRVFVYLNDYEAVRAEILQLSTKQSAYLVVTLPVAGFAFTYATGFASNLPIKAEVFAFLAMTLSVMGFLFCDLDRAILRCAIYTVTIIRPPLCKLIADDEILGWEHYIRRCSPIRYSPIKLRQTFIQGGLIFVPALCCLVLFFYFLFHPPQYQNGQISKPTAQLAAHTVPQARILQGTSQTSQSIATKASPAVRDAEIAAQNALVAEKTAEAAAQVAQTAAHAADAAAQMAQAAQSPQTVKPPLVPRWITCALMGLAPVFVLYFMFDLARLFREPEALQSLSWPPSASRSIPPPPAPSTSPATSPAPPASPTVKITSP